MEEFTTSTTTVQKENWKEIMKIAEREFKSS